MTADEILPVFREQFPEYASKSDAAVTVFLDNALLIHAICEMATVYLSAHLIVINEASGVGVSGGELDGGGPRETVSEAAKSVSASFKTIAADGTDAFYSVTPYGRIYIIMREACPGKKFSVRIA